MAKLAEVEAEQRQVRRCRLGPYPRPVTAHERPPSSFAQMEEERDRLKYQVLHLSRALRNSDQAATKLEDKNARLQYQVQHLCRAVKETDRNVALVGSLH